VPHEQLPQWLVAADLFVLPTLAEGCPNAVVEAMACGLPIVSSDIAALRETVGEGNGILVDPLDVSALSRAIATVLSDAGQRAQMSAAALARGTRLSAAARAERILDWMGDITPAMKRVQR
jgi:glycosyltransferase involved in cell wall biosynthesis